MKKLTVLLALLLFTCAAGAQELPKRKVWDWKFFAASAASVGLMVLDVETTQRSLQRCWYCTEQSAWLFGSRRPSRGRMYSRLIPIKAGEIGISALLKRRKSGDLQKAWWFPQFAGSVIHTVGIAGNLGQPASPRPKTCPAAGAGCAP